MSQKISACLIVLNEADVLPRCLESLKGHVDEIVAVDTGSTDGSQDILRAAGATVIEMAWQNDFAQARNTAISHASGDWILMIDADEALDPATASNLRALTPEVDQPVCYDMPIRSYMSDDETDGDTTLSWMPRLFNQPQDHFYLGRIHEQLIGSRSVRLEAEILCLLHWGYQPSRRASKQKEKRNVALLDANAAAGEQLMVTEIYKAYHASDPAEILKHAEAALEAYMAKGGTFIASASISNRILEGHLLNNDPAQATARGQELLGQYPQLETDLYFCILMGKAFKDAGQNPEAEDFMRKALALLEGSRALQTYRSGRVLETLALNLADLLVQTGRHDEADALLTQATAWPEQPKAQRANLYSAAARVAHLRQDDATALARALQAVELAPSLRPRLANDLLNQGAYVQAMQVMRPMLGDALKARVLDLATARQEDRQIGDLLTWYLDQVQDDPDVRWQRAAHAHLNYDHDAAGADLARLLGVSATDIQVGLHLAHLDQKAGRLDDADRRLAELAAEAQSEGQDGWLHQVLTQWGNLAYHRREWDKAADLFSEALALRPQDVYLHVVAGSAHAALGNLPDARKHVERALVIDPAYQPAHQVLNDLERLEGSRA